MSEQFPIAVNEVTVVFAVVDDRACPVKHSAKPRPRKPGSACKLTNDIDHIFFKFWVLAHENDVVPQVFTASFTSLPDKRKSGLLCQRLKRGGVVSPTHVEVNRGVNRSWQGGSVRGRRRYVR